ncbi:DUF1824 family protein [Leptolyngbya ohadii]|uniref:DUF1824 family protein n=1 Tax=Leptolyngbya ohadii TaxID=1962290 RepID=UPI000B59D41E|nr:DUF1824 family protein [Leptolyngbya ohadii]
MPSPTVLTLAEADRLLKQFSCLKPLDNPSDQDSSGDRAQLRQALLQVVAESDYQMLGICADSIEQGQKALVSYAKALGYPPNLEVQCIDGPVYIKFNSKAMSCYSSPYEGEHRGVLVSCQSTDGEGINEMYGHLPIDLFAD